MRPNETEKAQKPGKGAQASPSSSSTEPAAKEKPSPSATASGEEEPDSLTEEELEEATEKLESEEESLDLEADMQQQQPQAAEIIQQLQDLQVKADTLDTSITAINSEISSSKRGPITEANTFHGHPGEDIDTFLYSFELKATANNWTAEKQLNELPLCLQDTAMRIYRQLEAGQKDTFAHLRTALKDAFRTPGAESVARAKLYRFKQMPGQTVLEYATKLQDVFAAAYPNLPAAESDKILLDHFLNNIRETLGDKVKMFEPENFKAALAKAQKLEAQDNEKFSKQVHSIGSGNSHGQAYQRPRRGWRNNAAQDRMSTREQVQCFNCQELRSLR